jgi:hypothetical protein
MNYGYPINQIELKKIIGLFSDPNKFILLVGNYDKLSSTNIVSRDPQKLVELISIAQNINPLQRSGVYLYNLLSDEQIEKLRTGPFKEPSKPNWYIKQYSPPPSPPHLYLYKEQI